VHGMPPAGGSDGAAAAKAALRRRCWPRPEPLDGRAARRRRPARSATRCSACPRRRWPAPPPPTTRSAPEPDTRRAGSTRCGSAARTSCCRCCCRTGDLDWASYEGPEFAAAPALAAGCCSRPSRRSGGRRRQRRPGDAPARAGGGTAGVPAGAGAGGSYDLRLARVGAPVPTVALLYDGELIDEVPAGPHDLPVRMIARPPRRNHQACLKRLLPFGQLDIGVVLTPPRRNVCRPTSKRLHRLVRSASEGGAEVH